MSTPLYQYEADLYNIDWIVNLIKSWIKLQTKKREDVRLTLILSNYPIKDGRIANGVGLDTPASTINILTWLKREGYNLVLNKIPINSKELMKRILNSRTNSSETKM